MAEKTVEKYNQINGREEKMRGDDERIRQERRSQRSKNLGKYTRLLASLSR